MAGMGQVYDIVEEASLNSSTGSNNPVIDENELSDDISSNPYNQTSCRQRKFYTPRTICDAILQNKVNRGIIYKSYDWLTSDTNEARLFFAQPENIRMDCLIERMSKKDVHEKDATADVKDCIFEPREYTPEMIRKSLSKYPFSRHGFWDAHDLLMSSYKEVVLFFGLPSTLRMGWIVKRVEKRREEVMREGLGRKRKGVGGEEGLNKKRRSGRY